MLLQMVPGAINQAAENFMQMFLLSERQNIRERSLEAREKRVELDEREFENMLRARTALSEAQMQANPQLQQDPVVGSVLGQIANAQTGEGTVQALGPAVNQAIINQASQAATGAGQQAPQGEIEAAGQTFGVPGAGAGAPTQAPPMGQVSQAAEQMGLPSGSREAIQRATTPTPEQAADVAAETAEDRLAVMQAVPALRLGEAIGRGEVTLEEAAASNDPQMLMAAGQLGLDEEIRAMRNDFRSDLASQRDFRESIQKSAVDQAESLLDETNLEGEIPLGPVVRGIRDGFGALPEEQQELVAPLRQQLRQSRLKQQAAMLSEMEDTPAQQVLSTLANTALEAGNNELAIEYYNQKRDIAQRQTGLSGEDLPYPQLGEEFTTADQIINAIVPFDDPRRGDITVDLPNVDGEFTQDELQDVSNFIVTEHDGDVQAAFRAMQQRVRDAGGVEEIPEDARRTFEAVRFLRDSLRSNGNSE